MKDSTLYFPNVTSTRKKIEHNEHKLVKGVVFFLVLAILAGGAFLARRNNITYSDSTIKRAGGKSEPSPTSSPTPKPREMTELIGTITRIINEHEGMYSVRFEDFTETSSFGINDEVVVDAASVNKIPILAALYYNVDKGEINLDQEITIANEDVQSYGTGTIYTRKPPHVYTIRELARLMMEVSDNTAAFVLSNRIVGRANVQLVADEFGMTNTDISENTTTNRDQARLMRAMFEGKIANEQLTEEMIGWLDDSIFEDRLPSQLPEDVNVYHKIGNQVRVIHDIGVIMFDDKQYYLGVLTTDIPDEAEAKQTIGELSKAVYDFLKKPS